MNEKTATGSLPGQGVDAARAAIARVPAFTCLPDGELDGLAPLFVRVTVPLGQNVFAQGDPADALYIVASGKARVVQSGSDGSQASVSLLNAGDCFGELALLRGDTRTATVRAASPLDLLRLDRAEFERLCSVHPELRARFEAAVEDVVLRDFLRHYSRFAGVPWQATRALAERLRPLQLPAGSRIINEGEAGDALYVLRSGEAFAVKESVGGGHLAEFKPGDVFGELALLQDAVRAASVIAATDVALLQLRREDFSELSQAFPGLQDGLASLALRYTGGRAVATSPTPPVPRPAPAPREATPLQPAGRRARRHPVVLQLSEMDCGVACLAMVLAAYGRDVGISRLREEVDLSAAGAALADLVDAAERFGFATTVLRGTYLALAGRPLPAIVHWGGVHWVVLYEVHADRVLIGDPARGLITVSKDEFVKAWTGTVLLLQPPPEVRPEAGRLVRRLGAIGNLPGRARDGVALIGATLLAGLALVGAAALGSQALVRAVQKQDSWLTLRFIVAGLLALAAAGLLELRKRSLEREAVAGSALVNAGFQHLLGLPFRFFESRRPGELLDRSADAQRLQAALLGLAPRVLDLLLLLPAVAAAPAAGPVLAAILWLMIVVMLAACVLAHAVLRAKAEALLQTDSQLAFTGSEPLHQFATVKTLGLEQHFRWRQSRVVDELVARQRSFNAAAAGARAAAGVVGVAGLVALSAGGSALLERGDVSPSQWLLALVLGAMAGGVLLRFMSDLPALEEALVRSHKLADILSLTAEPNAGESQAVLETVRCEDVSFRYHAGQRNALRNIDLTLERGKTVVVVGTSGAGKSTLVRLLLGLSTPSSGRITVNGADLSMLSSQRWRARLGIAQRQNHLFAMSIGENLSIGRPAAEPADILGATLLTGAHAAIAALPAGYATFISEGGDELALAARQRLLIARAVLRRPPMFVFDDAADALRPDEERSLLARLRELAHNGILIWTTSRPAVALEADVAVVLEQGGITEQGEPAELRAGGGRFAALLEAAAGDRHR